MICDEDLWFIRAISILFGYSVCWKTYVTAVFAFEKLADIIICQLAVFIFSVKRYTEGNGGKSMKKIMTIGGSDPFAGGGIQSDLKTFENYHLFGMSALTCVGMLDENGHFVLEDLPVIWLERQLQSIQSMTQLDGIKIGLLHSLEAIEVVRDFLKMNTGIPIILDPVLAFKETSTAANKEYTEKIILELFPLVDVVTPNLKEASLLSNEVVTTVTQMETCAQKIYSLGAKNVVIKGGAGIMGNEALDLLYDGDIFIKFKRKKLQKTTVNGAGCTFSSAIAANLVKGKTLPEAIAYSKDYVYECILNGVMMNNQTGSVWSTGKGVD